MMQAVGNEEIVRGFDEETCDYLAVRLQKVEGASSCVLVELSGSIDTYNANFVRRAVMRVMESGFRHVILGLRSVDYVSSAGVGTLLTLLRILMENGGNLTLLQPHPKVATVLRLMHLETFFPLATSVRDALNGSPLAGTVVFPLKTQCPLCDTVLRAQEPGRFRCPKCKTVLRVHADGQSTVG